MTRFIRWCLERFGSARDHARTTSAAPVMRAAPDLLDTRKRRAEAYARVVDAEARHDDRDLGRARMQLQEATHAELAEAVW